MVARRCGCILVSASLSLVSCAAPVQDIPAGKSVLAIETRSDGRVVPARVEIVDAAGTPIVPDDALPTWGDCSERRSQMTPEEWDDLAVDHYRDFFTGEVHHYSTGRVEAVVAPGSYRIRVRKGPEYRVAERTISVEQGQPAELVVDLERWVHMAEEGWYSGDAHLHIPRLDGSRDDAIADWMRAEDLNVANVLQFGNARGFLESPQFAFGPQGVYQGDDILIIPGQENPRISILGHMLQLGGSEPVDLRDGYFDLLAFAQAAQRVGAVQGFAHKAGYGGEAGMALLLPYDAMQILEILTRSVDYEAWYDALNMGARIAPVAGTDYPCGTGRIMPGAQRVYVRSETLSAEGWLDGLRRGRTFVSNGPVVDLEVEGEDIGAELSLEKPRSVRVDLGVRFDPEQQRVTRVSLIVGGATEHTWTPDQSGELRARWRVDVAASTWIAVRVDGVRTGSPRRLPVIAHTAPVWIRVGEQWDRRTRTAQWLERLDALEGSLAESRWRELPSMSLDGFSPDDLRQARGVILRRITQARRALRNARR